IDGMRAIYNSAAIGMATALLATIFIGLIGFYVISNAVRRDLLSRCGFVAASTTMKSSEYIAGKFLGNVVFLSTFMAGFAAVSMAMVLVRGEAPLEPWIFVKQYLLLVPPVIVFVSAMAILFEAVPFLSGKFGDVVYFIAWVSSMGVVAAVTEHSGNPTGLISYFDFTGFAYLWNFMHQVTHTGSLSIGATSFDPKLPVYVFTGLSLNAAWAVRRLGAALSPLLLAGVAVLFFHRFDPVRVRNTVRHNGANLLARINLKFKPLTRVAVRLISVGQKPSIARSTFAEAIMTASGSPAVAIAAVVFAVIALTSPAAQVSSGSLPLAFAVAGIAIADLSCREWRAGTQPLVYSAPRLQAMFIVWKFCAGVLVAAAILAMPIARSATSPGFAIAGALFLCAAAVTLGVISNNAKTFTVLFLTFWYVVMNNKGATPALDFAGFFGRATPVTIAMYAAVGAAMLATAQFVHARRLLRA
ncbi:MAG: hypothetical protein ACXV7D_11610, partial [Thermoanaerobaculia bacterium]